jgi:multidrug efflux pump
MGTLAELARRVLPNGMTIEWTDLSFQEATQGNAALLVFPVLRPGFETLGWAYSGGQL